MRISLVLLLCLTIVVVNSTTSKTTRRHVEVTAEQGTTKAPASKSAYAYLRSIRGNNSCASGSCPFWERHGRSFSALRCYARQYQECTCLHRMCFSSCMFSRPVCNQEMVSCLREICPRCMPTSASAMCAVYDSMAERVADALSVFACYPCCPNVHGGSPSNANVASTTVTTTPVWPGFSTTFPSGQTEEINDPTATENLAGGDYYSVNDYQNGANPLPGSNQNGQNYPSNNVNSGAITNGNVNGISNGNGNAYSNGNLNGISNGNSNAYSNGNLNGISNGNTNAFSNGNLNGISNGNTNAFSNGNLNGVSNENSNAYSNGNINGISNANSNAYSNGNVNGISNENSNAYSNGNLNGVSNGNSNAYSNGNLNGVSNGNSNGFTNSNGNAYSNDNVMTNGNGYNNGNGNTNSNGNNYASENGNTNSNGNSVTSGNGNGNSNSNSNSNSNGNGNGNSGNCNEGNKYPGVVFPGSDAIFCNNFPHRQQQVIKQRARQTIRTTKRRLTATRKTPLTTRRMAEALVTVRGNKVKSGIRKPVQTQKKPQTNNRVQS